MYIFVLAHVKRMTPFPVIITGSVSHRSQAEEPRRLQLSAANKYEATKGGSKSAKQVEDV